VFIGNLLKTECWWTEVASDWSMVWHPAKYRWSGNWPMTCSTWCMCQSQRKAFWTHAMVYCSTTVNNLLWNLCPIHTADADATQLSSWVASASRRRRRCVLNSQLAHNDCWRLPTKIWKLNTLRIYPVELSRVELCRRCVHTRRLSWPSLQFCSLWLAQKIGNWVMTDNWCVHTADATQLHSWVASASAVCNVYWALHSVIFCFTTFNQSWLLKF